MRRPSRRLLSACLVLSATGAFPGVAAADDGVPQLCPENAVAVVSKCALYATRYTSAGDETDIAYDAAISDDGSIVATSGLTTVNGPLEQLTVALDGRTGAVRWARTFRPDGGDAQGRTVVLSPDGSTVYSSGLGRVPAGLDDAWTIAYDALTGAEKWRAAYDNPTHSADESRIADVSPDGSRLYVAGWACICAEGSGSTPYEGKVHGTDWYVVAYDTATGAQLWSRVYDSVGAVGNHQDLVEGIDVSPDGTRLALTGRWANAVFTQSGLHRGTDMNTTVVSAATGEPLWSDVYTNVASPNVYPHVIRWSPDGTSVYAAGDTFAETNTYRAVTLAYDAATGVRRWTRVYAGQTANGGPAAFDGVVDLVVAPDSSRVYSLTSSSIDVVTRADFLTEAVSPADGSVLWSARYDGSPSGGDLPYTIGLSPDGGTVYVAGQSQYAANGYDATTVAYHALDGTRRWVANYSGPNTEDPQGEQDQRVLVSGDGSRVVTITDSPGLGSGDDFVVLGYDTSAEGGPAPVVPELPFLPLAVAVAVALIARVSRRHRQV